MSLADTHRVDAATLRDGWAVLTIHHYEDWEPIHERIEQLEQKLASYEQFLQTYRYLMRFSERPVRFELSCTLAPPDSIRDICKAWSVTILGPAESPSFSR